MTGSEGLIALVVGLLTTGGGARWFFGWLDRRQAKQHAHELAMADRYDAHQRAYLDAQKAMQEREDKREEREERRRQEHLSDARMWGESLAELAAQVRADSRRPPGGS